MFDSRATISYSFIHTLYSLWQITLYMSIVNIERSMFCSRRMVQTQITMIIASIAHQCVFRIVECPKMDQLIENLKAIQATFFIAENDIVLSFRKI